MAEVVVVGAGLGGMAVAARLAKQRHRVTILERNADAGRRDRPDRAGRIQLGLRPDLDRAARRASRPVPQVGSSARTLRRTRASRGRPPPRVRRRRASVDLPTGSRGDQIDAVDAGLGPWHRQAVGRVRRRAVGGLGGAAAARCSTIPGAGGGSATAPSPKAAALVHVAGEAAQAVARATSDCGRWCRSTSRSLGSHPRDVPSYAAVQPYVERSFGVWGATGGMAAVADALVTRLAERGVELRCDSPVASIDVTDGSRARRRAGRRRTARGRCRRRRRRPAAGVHASCCPPERLTEPRATVRRRRRPRSRRRSPISGIVRASVPTYPTRSCCTATR